MKDAIIIGAGITGLATAHHLKKKAGFDFLVLEQSDRVGGVIHTVKENIFEYIGQNKHLLGKDELYTINVIKYADEKLKEEI